MDAKLKALGDSIKKMKVAELFAKTTTPSPVILCGEEYNHSHIVESAAIAYRKRNQYRVPKHLFDTMFR